MYIFPPNNVQKFPVFCYITYSVPWIGLNKFSRLLSKISDFFQVYPRGRISKSRLYFNTIDPPPPIFNTIDPPPPIFDTVDPPPIFDRQKKNQLQFYNLYIQELLVHLFVM